MNNQCQLLVSKFCLLLKRKKGDDTPIIISKEVTDHIDPLNGKSEIILSSSDTEIDHGLYYYDLTLYDNNNNPSTITCDKFQVKQGLI